MTSAKQVVKTRRGEEVKVETAQHIHNVAVISDLHIGCQMGLCPSDGLQLDGGGTYKPSEAVCRMWSAWNEFWKWVIHACRREPYAVVINGDLFDGRHHDNVTHISSNHADQYKLAVRILEPIREKCTKLFIVRGTESHCGAASENEERLAIALDAEPDDTGNRTCYELWLNIDNHLAHFAHHIGSTGSSAYESTALQREFVEMYSESAKAGKQPPEIVVRSHRHRHMEVRSSVGSGFGSTVVTPGWQLKPPYVMRSMSGRVSPPQIGGIIIRLGDEELYTRPKTWYLERPAEVML